MESPNVKQTGANIVQLKKKLWLTVKMANKSESCISEIVQKKTGSYHCDCWYFNQHSFSEKYSNDKMLAGYMQFSPYLCFEKSNENIYKKLII